MKGEECMVHIKVTLRTEKALEGIEAWFSQSVGVDPLNCPHLQRSLSEFESLEDTVGEILAGKIAKQMGSRSDRVRDLVSFLKGEDSIKKSPPAKTLAFRSLESLVPKIHNQLMPNRIESSDP